MKTCVYSFHILALPAGAGGGLCCRPGPGVWLVVGWLPCYWVGPRGRVGLVTPTPNGHLPALLGNRATGKLGFCPLDKAVEVNPGLSNREEMRLVVLSPQHQATVYGNV
jgi:hypothetical protein